MPAPDAPGGGGGDARAGREPPSLPVAPAVPGSLVGQTVVLDFAVQRGGLRMEPFVGTIRDFKTCSDGVLRWKVMFPEDKLGNRVDTHWFAWGPSGRPKSKTASDGYTHGLWRGLARVPQHGRAGLPVVAMKPGHPALDGQLSRLRLCLVDTAADGNCLFNAVCHQLALPTVANARRSSAPFTSENCAALRDVVHRYLSSYPPGSALRTLAGSGWESILTAVATNGSPSGGFALRALAICLGRDIVLLNGAGDDVSTIFVYYSDPNWLTQDRLHDICAPRVGLSDTTASLEAWLAGTHALSTGGAQAGRGQ